MKSVIGKELLKVFRALDEHHAKSQHGMVGSPEACFCVGPQNGQPRCPCAMRGIIIRDGRYIQPEVDLGPVKRGEK